jgi:hypothetical protein
LLTWEINWKIRVESAFFWDILLLPKLTIYLYDEENKKFFLSRDVIFLEFDEDAHNIEKQLSHLDRFQSKKFYHGWDNELPTLEGRIPFLGQSLEVSKNEEPTEREDNSSKKKPQNLK